MRIDQLFDLRFSSTKANIMMTAIELDLFSKLINPMTAQELADAVGLHPENTELFLNALTAVGFLDKKDGRFGNGKLADTCLVKGKDNWLGDHLLMTEQFCFQNRQQVKDLLLNGPPKETKEREMDGDFYAAYVDGMLNFSRSGVSQAVSAALTSLPEFQNLKTMVDIGGAHGLDCIAIVAEHPSMTGIVFDKPSVVALTQKIIAQYGMEDRIDVLGGDYTTDSIGSSYNLVYAKGTLNFAGPAINSVLGKIYNSLNEGGVFVSIHDGLVNEKTKPEDLVISWLPIAMSLMDVSFEQHIIPDAMKAAGFKEIEVKPFSFPMGKRLDMVIGRKK